MKYLHGPGIDEPLKGIGADYTETYFADGLGSIVKIVRSNGDHLNLVYDSFGNVKVFNSTGQEVSLDKLSTLTYGYTGRELDPESSFYYYRARYYNPSTARFISSDKVGMSSGNMNFYAYVNNRPTSFVDPTGETPVLLVFRAISCLTALGAGIIEGFDAYAAAGVIASLGESISVHDGIISGIDKELENDCLKGADKRRAQKLRSELDFERRKLKTQLTLESSKFGGSLFKTAGAIGAKAVLKCFNLKGGL